MIFDNSYRSVSKGIIGLCALVIVLSKFNLSYNNFQILTGGLIGINIIFFLSGFLVTKYFYSKGIQNYLNQKYTS